MRRGRILTTVAAVGAVTLLVASAAIAASPRQIYRDLATNGKLTKHYSVADLQAAAHDASVQGYGGVQTKTLRPVIQQQVAAAKKTLTQSAPKAAVKSAVASRSAAAPQGKTLPFTGQQLGGFAAIGLALLASGLLLRWSARRRPLD
jgi:hypothetical protein